MAPNKRSIGALALGPIPARSGRRPAVSLAAALAIHLLAGAGFLLAPAAAELPAPSPARQLHVIEMVAPPRPPPPPAPPPAPEPELPTPPTASRPTPRATPPRPAVEAPPSPAEVAPARAGQVIAAAPAADVADFTDFEIAVGDGHYVGGVTSAAGTNTVAARGDSVAAGGVVGRSVGGGASEARSVRLPGGNWDCPWPDDARALRVREQEVRLRVLVDADGTALSAEILDDPGNGFGDAAIRCARSARFEPALDAGGRPIRSRSPAIRVRFSR